MRNVREFTGGSRLIEVAATAGGTVYPNKPQVLLYIRGILVGLNYTGMLS